MGCLAQLLWYLYRTAPFIYLFWNNKMLVSCRPTAELNEAFIAHMRTCEEMWGYVRTCEDMWGHERICEGMRCYVRTCEDMWGHVRICENMWGYVSIYSKARVIVFEVPSVHTYSWMLYRKGLSTEIKHHVIKLKEFFAYFKVFLNGVMNFFNLCSA